MNDSFFLNREKLPLFCINGGNRSLYLSKNVGMESSFYDTFKEMLGCAKEFMLVQAIHEVVNISRTEIADNCDFHDLLRALSEYTSRQEKRERKVDTGSNLGSINHFLSAAVDKLDHAAGDNVLARASVNQTKMFAEQFRRLLLLEFVGIWIKTLEHERYRFSDLLNSLAHYARQQIELLPANACVWEVVATLLETAATEAKRQGDNLP